MAGVDVSKDYASTRVPVLITHPPPLLLLFASVSVSVDRQLVLKLINLK